MFVPGRQDLMECPLAVLFILWLAFTCLLSLLAATATGQQPAVPDQGASQAAVAQQTRAKDQGALPIGGGKPSAVPANSLAAALRASTRNDPAYHVPSASLIQEFLDGPHTGPADEAVVGVEVINQAKGGATETRRCSGLL